MNIFVLDENPVKAARYACDKHVVKMVLESAQLLCSAHPDGEAPYKQAFYNHPCSCWTRACTENYSWLVDHALALCDEYSHRYGRTHKSEEVIRWCDDNRPDIPIGMMCDHPLCMPEEVKKDSVVESYRNYYNIS